MQTPGDFAIFTLLSINKCRTQHNFHLTVLTLYRLSFSKNLGTTYPKLIRTTWTQRRVPYRLTRHP
jgi:hypothetical protein